MIAKILLPIIIILIIFFVFSYKKNFNENFTSDNFELNFSRENSIFMISKNMSSVTQTERGTIFKKSNMLIKSNKTLYGEKGNFSGFIFQPEKNKKFKIGFSNLKDNKEGEIDYCFNMLGNNTVEIIERYNDTNLYNVVDINYCGEGNLNKCSLTKNKITYDDNNLLGIVLRNNTANYFIINKNEEEYGSMLIHKSDTSLRFPLNIKVICYDDEVMVDNLFWINYYNIYNSPVFWNVETVFKSDYEKQKIEMAPSIEPPKITPAPSLVVEEDDDYFNFDNLFDSDRIEVLDVTIEDGRVNINYRHNMDKSTLSYYKDKVYLRLFRDDNLDNYNLVKFSELKNIKNFYPEEEFSAVQILLVGFSNDNLLSNIFVLEKETQEAVKKSSRTVSNNRQQNGNIETIYKVPTPSPSPSIN